MEYLQYGKACTITSSISNFGFKPYYKWNTFNTKMDPEKLLTALAVLNLIINGIPSIL